MGSERFLLKDSSSVNIYYSGSSSLQSLIKQQGSIIVKWLLIRTMILWVFILASLAAVAFASVGMMMMGSLSSQLQC